MAGRHLIGTDGRIELTLDGLTFRRGSSEASARGVDRLHHVGWDQVEGAELAATGKGKPLVQIRVAGSVPGGKHDPYAVKLKRGMAGDAAEFVGLVNDELAVRRRWAAAGDSA